VVVDVVGVVVVDVVGVVVVDVVGVVVVDVVGVVVVDVVGVVVVDVVGVVVVDVVGVVVVGFGTIVMQAEVNRNSEINTTPEKNRERLSSFLYMGCLLISATPIICLTFSRNPHEP